jgi:hypothetical protein
MKAMSRVHRWRKTTFVKLPPFDPWLGSSGFPSGIVVTVGPLILITVGAIGAAYWFVRPAPPNTITITSGPNGSTFRLTAEKYRKILARNGVKLRVYNWSS